MDAFDSKWEQWVREMDSKLSRLNETLEPLSELDALRQRVSELENAIGNLALECGQDKMEHFQRSVAAEMDENWQTAHAESKHAMALGWCEERLYKLLAK